MILGTTAYLLGFLAVLLPIVIHLWSKKTRKTIPFGTIRFFTEDDTQAVKSPIPTEWLLLLLRILMLVILVLILSDPLQRNTHQEKVLVLMDPVYQDHRDFEILTDSLLHSAEVRWFSKGFPLVEDTLIVANTSHWELLADLEKEAADQITIVSPRRFSQFMGERPATTPVSWVSLPQNDLELDLGSFRSGTGGIKINVTSDQQATYFEHDETDISFLDSLVIKVAIESDDAFTELSDFIRASIEAINEDSPLRIKLVQEADADWLIWLKQEPRPNRQQLIFANTQFDTQILRQVSRNVFEISAFEVEAFLADNFPLQLEQVLGKSMMDVGAYDWRAMPEGQLPELSQHTSAAYVETTSSLSTWFWGLLLAVLLVERYLSLKTTAAE